jgi:dTMP kinase
MGVQRGLFITLEGGEGAGKSTQARRLAERLAVLGVAVVSTREPGGTPGAEALRNMLVAGGADRWSPISEALLMNAARSDHLERLIRPALARGDWVICDRFADSTRAYQGAGGGVDPEFVEALERAVVGADMPDLTLIFDLPAEAGLARATARDAEAQGRFEAKGLAFHEALRDEFLVIADGESQRCALIDAAADIDSVAEQIWTAVSERLLP